MLQARWRQIDTRLTEMPYATQVSGDAPAPGVRFYMLCEARRHIRRQPPDCGGNVPKNGTMGVARGKTLMVRATGVARLTARARRPYRRLVMTHGSVAMPQVGQASSQSEVAARPVSLADRLTRRFLDKAKPDETRAFPPRPTQLALPFGNETPGMPDPAIALPSLFREARRVEPVLSYEQARLDQIIPDISPAPGAPRDGLILPGGVGLVLHAGIGDELAFDWMQWGEAADPARERQGPDATISLDDLGKGPRATRKLARRRCVIPLTRYSVPVRDGDVWSHLWVTPAPGHFACAAGVWTADGTKRARFAMVTETGDPTGPLLLAESDLLTWLRAPLRDAIARITRRPASQR